MAKITQSGFGKDRRRNYQPGTQLDPMNPLRSRALDTRGVEKGLRGLAGLFLGAQEEDRKQVLKDNLYDDRRGIELWAANNQHHLTVVLDQAIHEQEMNQDGYDILAILDGTTEALLGLDDEFTPKTDAGKKLYKEGISDRNKHLRPMIITKSLEGLIRRHKKAAQEEIAGLSTVMNEHGVMVPRTDWSASVLSSTLEPRMWEMAQAFEEAMLAGATSMDLAALKSSADGALMSTLMAWSSEANESGTNLSYYLGLMGDNVKVETADGTGRTVVLDKNMSDEDARLIAKLFLVTEPTDDDIEKLRTLVPDGIPVELGMGFQTALLQAGLPEDVVMQWLSNEVGNMYQDMKKLLVDEGAAAGAISVTADRVGQALGVPASGNGGTGEFAAMATFFRGAGLEPELWDGVLKVIGESGESLANIEAETMNAGRQVLGLMRGERLTEPLSLGELIITEPSMQRMFSNLARNEINTVSTRIARAKAKERGTTWTNKSVPGIDDVAAAYAEVGSNYANNNGGNIPHFLLADMLNGFGNAQNPMHHVLESFLNNYWTPNDSWNIRKKPSDLTKSQRAFALSEGGPDDPQYFIDGGFGIEALLSGVDLPMDLLKTLFEGNRTLAEITGNDGKRLTLLEIHNAAVNMKSTNAINGARRRLGLGDFAGEASLSSRIVDILAKFGPDESPGLVSPADPTGPDFISNSLNYVTFGWWGNGRGLVGNPSSDYKPSRTELQRIYNEFSPDLIEMLTALEMIEPQSVTGGEGSDSRLTSLTMSWLHNRVRPFRFGPQDPGMGWSERSSLVYAGNIPGTEGKSPEELRQVLATAVFNHLQTVPQEQWGVKEKDYPELERRIKAFADSEWVTSNWPDRSGFPSGFSGAELVRRLSDSGWDVAAALDEQLRSSASAKEKAFVKHSAKPLVKGKKKPKFKWVDKPLVTTDNILSFFDTKMVTLPVVSSSGVHKEWIAYQMLAKSEEGERTIHLVDNGDGGMTIGVKLVGAPYDSPAAPVFLGTSNTPLIVSRETLMDSRPIGYRLLEEAGATPKQIEQVVLSLSELAAKRAKEREAGRRSGGY